jgi:hypothetical protein
VSVELLVHRVDLGEARLQVKPPLLFLFRRGCTLVLTPRALSFAQRPHLLPLGEALLSLDFALMLCERPGEGRTATTHERSI